MKTSSRSLINDSETALRISIALENKAVFARGSRKGRLYHEAAEMLELSHKLPSRYELGMTVPEGGH